MNLIKLLNVTIALVYTQTGEPELYVLVKLLGSVLYS